jgi:hypothetical protein
MKKIIVVLAVCIISCLIAASVEAGTFVSGSTGADGPFNPPAQVPAGTVVDGNTVIVPLPANGILNFTTVYIATGTTVTFTRNAANTPVYLLASGDVNIAGTIDVSGQDGAAGNIGNIGPVAGGKGGPGGFDGGYGGQPNSTGIPGVLPGQGLGPGGGCSDAEGVSLPGCGGSFASAGGSLYSQNTVSGYGSYALQPLVGGSGGGGGGYYSSLATRYYGGGGGGGGGAILIASSGSINITGAIIANGGFAGGGGQGQNYGGDGSGGGIRLVANTINNNGSISAMPPRTYNLSAWLSFAGVGRIRIESYNLSLGSMNPYPSITLPNAVVMPNIPSLSITQINGVLVPPAATGSYTSPDISLPAATSSPVSVDVSAANIPVGTSVEIDAVPQSGSSSSVTTTLVGTDASSTASANLNISTTFPSIISAQTTFNVQTAMYFGGEKIEKVKVASSLTDGKSKVIYITKSGKEISAEILFASLMK